MNVRTVVDAMEAIAPLRFAAEWDNVGLLLGAGQWAADSIMLTIDLTEDVLAEAIAAKAQMIVAYHPPIFEPLNRLTDATLKEHLVLEAARHGMSIYSPHTALDAAPNGVNDWLAGSIAVGASGDVRALEPYRDLPSTEECKVITFCPADAIEAIRNGLAAVGAGRIGDYQLCSFELSGRGTFYGGSGTKPTIGQRGSLQHVDEVRLEMVCPRSSLGLAVVALREFHPYEEPPIEIYPLEARPQRNIGHGRRVVLDQRVDLPTLVARIKSRLGTTRVRVAIGRNAPEQFGTIGLCPGAGGSFLDAALEQGCELYFTGEMRHHDVLAAQARGCTVVLAGHTNTERGYLPVLRERMLQSLQGTSISIASADVDPLAAM